jgi:hypothetical protein
VRRSWCGCPVCCCSSSGSCPGSPKVISGDEGWRQLTALHRYFETQPLPHASVSHAHHLPDRLLRVGTGGTLFVERIVPHQPRLDWQLWFVPKGPVFLGDFETLLTRLREGSPIALSLSA